MVVKNTSERRLSMGQFAGLFVAALAISCFAFTHSYNNYEKIPQEQLTILLNKQKMMESLVNLSISLRQFETEQLAGSLTAVNKEAEVAEKMVVIRRQLVHEDTLGTYSDIQKLLDMAAQYQYFIKKISKEGDQKIQVLNQQIADLQQRLQLGEMDKKSAQIQAQTQVLQATRNAGISNQTAPPKPSESGGSMTMIPPTNTGNANCDQQVNQTKSQYQRALSPMRAALSQIRSDVNNISKGLFNRNAEEKGRIESNLQKMEQQIEALNN